MFLRISLQEPCGNKQISIFGNEDIEIQNRFKKKVDRTNVIGSLKLKVQ